MLGTNRSSTQAISLTINAYNGTSVTGIDIVCSLPVTGREFHYPIEYTASEHTNLTFGVNTIQDFTNEQEKMLSCSRKVFYILIQETRTWNREYRNYQKPNNKYTIFGTLSLHGRK